MIKGACDCGALSWRFDGAPASVTACSCNICRRYGVLWAYDYEGERIHVAGPSKVYLRDEKAIAFHFCPACGCVAYWRGVAPRADGRRRIAVNVRLALDPQAVAALPVDHFDGLESWSDLPRDGRCVRDMWF